MKIALLGFSGSGKSTLSAKLGSFYKIPVFYFDQIHCNSGWTVTSKEEKLQKTKEFMDNYDQWIMDGNYANYYLERRVEEADKIIILIFNRFNCLYRIFKRYKQYKNKTRPSMAPGCNEKIDWEFIQWILWKGRTREDKKRYNEIKSKYPQKVVFIKNQKQLNKLEADIFYNKLWSTS